jgi:hypothetical protein
MPSETNVISFGVRFVYDASPENAAHPATGWHGVIRHVQSDAERHFTRWADAVAFVAQFVGVSDEASGSVTRGE